jgi:two-component system, LytTR family, response regulator AlgR
MNPIKVLIVDDEALARQRLRTLLGDCRQPAAVVVAEAPNAAQAIEALRRSPVDLALLDIHMPGADGLKLARTLRELPAPPAVVFVTAHAEHAVTAFELEALDYLTKPVRLERLQQMLHKLLQKIERSVGVNTGQMLDFQHEEVLVIQERGKLIKLPLGEVLYLKAELKYITVRTAAGEHLLEASLGELEVRYPTRFIRVHRNALAARHVLRGLERQDGDEGEAWVLRLDGLPETLAVSRRQLAAVREALAG